MVAATLGLALIGSTLLILWASRRRPYLGVGWLWYLGTLVPTIGLVQFGSLLAGTIIVEKVFARPGLGSLLLQAIEMRNYRIVQGCVLFIAFGYVLVNLLTDILYTRLDPRIKLSR